MEKVTNDVRPDYYKKSGLECFDVIRAMTENLQGEEAFDIGCVTKYIWRYKEKNGAEDIRKAITYLKKVLNILEEEQ